MSGGQGDGSDGIEDNVKMKAEPVSPRVCPPQSPRSPPPYLGSLEACESPNVEDHGGDREGKDSSHAMPTNTGVVGKGGGGPFPGPLSFTRFSSDMERIKRAELDSSRDFEQMRASYFADQYHSNRSYFEAFCAMIPVHKDSMQRTVRYFLGRVAMQRKIVEWSCELNDSILGAKKGTTKSHLYKSKKALSKCTQQTAQFDNQNDTETAVIWAAKAANIPLHMRRKASQEQLARRGSGQSHHSRQSSEMSFSGDGGLGFVDAEPTMKRHIIEEMTQSDVEIASRFDMLADFTEICVLKPLDAFEKEYIKESDEIIKCGREMLDALQSLDTHVAQWYEQLSKEINDNLLYKGGGASEGMKVVDIGDCWLANIQYSVSVDHQRHGWTLISSTMRDLFERFRTIELKRRMEMKRAIDVVCTRQEKMFSELPLATRTPHNSAQSISVDVSTLEEELKQQMRDNVPATQDTKGSNGQPSWRAGLDEPTGPPVDTPSISDDCAPLVMQSPLIHHCGIVQRKKDGPISSSWNLAVAVLTRDHFLHIFDIKNRDKNLTLDSKVEEGFKYAQPELWSKGISISKKELQNAMLEPSISLDVSQNYTNPCKSASKQKHARQFEVTEVKVNVGMKGAFKSESRRLLHIRAPSETSMMEWVVKLKAADPRNGTNEEAIRLAHF